MKITDSNRVGDVAEFYAVTWLWDNGYEVFLNPGATGFADMVAWKDGDCILIDIKTLYKSQIHNTRTKDQKEKGVRIIGFDPETRKLRWINHHKDAA